MSDRLSSGRPASSLDAANNDTGRVAFCGPYVLSAITGFGSDIDDIIRLGDQADMVLNDDDRAAFVNEAVKDIQEKLHVGHVKTDGGFLQQIKC